jgi:hypothetical protein
VRFDGWWHRAAAWLRASRRTKMVSETLGHRRIATIMNLYSRVTLAIQHEAINALDLSLSWVILGS